MANMLGRPAPADAWHGKLGPWKPIESASTADRVDLWIDGNDLSCEIVRDCWWNEEAQIPDWYARGHDGKPVLAFSIYHWASFWKPAGSADSPYEGGGPGPGAREHYDHDYPHTLPPGLVGRMERYLQTFDVEQIQALLIERLARPDPGTGEPGWGPGIVGDDVVHGGGHPIEPDVELEAFVQKEVAAIEREMGGLGPAELADVIERNATGHGYEPVSAAAIAGEFRRRAAALEEAEARAAGIDDGKAWLLRSGERNEHG